MKLKDKVALVTGSSQGIGKAIAIKLASEGAKVAVNYYSNEEGANDTATQIEQLHQKNNSANNDEPVTSVTQADVGQVDRATFLVESTIAKFGKLDILVNNAGLEINTPFWDVTEKEYDKVMNTNLKGTFFATQKFTQYLMEKKRTGRIINISSVHEELPFPNFTPYCLSKGGMKMFTRNLAVELGPFGITINNIAPGAIETPINKNLLNNKEQLDALLANIPLNRLGQPNDVSSLVAFLSTEDAGYITGSTFVVDGGLLWNYQEQ